MGMNEDDLSDVYDGYLERKHDKHLVSQLLKLIDEKPGDIGTAKLEDYERNQLINMIQNIDYTGKLDCTFEDTRKNLTSNESCG